MPDHTVRLKAALADRYALEEKLGIGGMATVYLATDLRHDRKVAVKVLRPELAVAIGAKRFLQEIQIAAKLSHPHILTLIDSGASEDLAYYIMPAVRGPSLRDRLNSEGKLSIGEVVRIAEQVADALAYAHSRGIVHRDVKPENILLDGTHVFLSDFGIARAIDLSEADRLTGTGIVLGTPSYMSPEQAAGEDNIDGRADTYALGCVIYEALAGEPPFGGRSVQAVVAKQILEPAPSLGTLRPEITIGIADAVRTALSKTPIDRFADVRDFAKALSAGQSGEAVRTTGGAVSVARSKKRAWRHRPVAVVVLLAGVSLLGVFAVNQMVTGDADVIPNARRSFIVLPQAGVQRSSEETSLTRDAEDELTRLLTGWDEARAVATASKTGFLFDLGVAEPASMTLPQSLAVARSASVGTLITLHVTVRGDSVTLTAELFDVATAELLGDPIISQSLTSDVFALVAPVAAQILNFGGAPELLLTFNVESSSLEAIRLVQSGRVNLEQWRLEAAERLFGEALTEDSTFARAHYFLSLTLYWQAASSPQRYPELGGAIRRHVAAARRHSATLVHRDSLFVEAFFSFQNGDFERARGIYGDLVRSDSTDTFAWLLLGSVEYQDFWAEKQPDGSLLPRSNLNTARRAFVRTVRLAPDFFLGYGHLFDIYQHLASESGRCPQFQPLGDEMLFLWETRDPGIQVAKCPVARDSIEWLDPAAVRALDRRERLVGAARMLDEAMVELRRWLQYAPDNPRPAEELSDWQLARADLLTRERQRSEGDSLRAEALRQLERAFALKPDTTPEDLVRLGSLYLTNDMVEQALFVTNRALELTPTDHGVTARVPPEAANIFLATGQVNRALAIALPVAAGQRMTVGDSVDNRPYDVLVESELSRLSVYGATGVTGRELGDALARIERAWSEAGYSERVQSLIRRAMTSTVRTALILDDAELHKWHAGWEPTRSAIVGLLALASDSGAARQRLGESLDEFGLRIPTPTDAYLTGVLAQRLTMHDEAIRAFREMDRSQFLLGSMSVEWGIRSLSYLLRARSYEAIGDAQAARTAYERFLTYWDTADPERQDRVREAQAALRRLSAAGGLDGQLD